MDEFFLPSIFNSQPCEETFRKMRSMGTVNFTRINFTLLELIHLVGRIELMNEIMYFKLADTDVCFPRDPVRKLNKSKFSLPKDEEIENILQKAMSVAIADAERFGINVTFDEIAECKLRDVDIDLNASNDCLNCENIDLGIASNENDDLLCHQNLKDYPQHSQDDENSSFINIPGKSGITKTVRKTSLMWDLSTTKERISSDRVKRVRGVNKKSCRQLEFVDVSAIDQPMYVAEQIKIGDWCIFRNIFDETPKTFIFGNIISFQYASKSKAYKDRKYLCDFAPTEDGKSSKKIDVLSSWYKLDANGIINLFDLPKCTFIAMDHYFATLSRHVIDRNNIGNICLSQTHLKLILNMLKDIKK